MVKLAVVANDAVLAKLEVKAYDAEMVDVTKLAVWENAENEDVVEYDALTAFPVLKEFTD